MDLLRPFRDLPDVGRRLLLVLALPVALGAVALGVYLHGGVRPTHPIDAVPPGTFIALDIDLATLRQNGSLAAILGDRSDSDLTSICGFDPLARTRGMAFIVPEGAEGDFGVAVDADVSPGELLSCADKVIRSHGGDPSPQISKRGTYTVVTPRQTSADGASGRAVAYGEDGPLLVGKGEWLTQMIDAVLRAQRGTPNDTRSDTPHDVLRKELGSLRGEPPRGERPFEMTATVIVTKQARENVRAQMLEEVHGVQGMTIMSGVLSVSSAGIGLYEQAGDVRAALDLICETADACHIVENMLKAKRLAASQSGATAALGLSSFLEHLDIEQSGDRVHLTGKLPRADLVRLVKDIIASHPFAPHGGMSTPPAADAGPSAGSLTVRVPASGIAPSAGALRLSVPGPGPSGQPGTDEVVRVPATVGSRTGPAPNPHPP